MTHDGRRLLIVTPLLLLGGCRPAPMPLPAATGPRPGYVDVSRYVRLHPAAAQLTALDRAIARVRRPGARASVTLPLTPAEVTLPEPRAPAVTPAAAPRADITRAEVSIRKDYAVRRLAEPDPAEETYQQRVEALRHEYLEAPPPPPPAPDVEKEIREAQAEAAEIAELERQVRGYQPGPNDRLVFRPNELMDRAARYQEARQKLVALRRARLARLQQPPVAPQRVAPTIPPALLKEAEQERDRKRAAQHSSLDEQERKELAALRGHAELPTPIIAAVPHQEAETVRPPSSFIFHPHSLGVKAPDDRGERADAAMGLVRQRDALRAQILADLRVAAAAAGKVQGVAVQFTPGSGPDETQRLLPSVRRALALTALGKTR